MKKMRYFFLAVSLLLFHSCLIENDMSYPRVSADFLTFEIEGQESVSIDTKTRTVSIVLSETADLTSLKISKVSFTEKTRCAPELKVGDVIDLSEPMKVTLSIYQDYVWTISATQTIERYVRCTGQVGDAQIDLDKHEVVVYVSSTQPLDAITIEAMKLEPDSSEILGYVENAGASSEKVTAFDFPLVLDCTVLRYFDIRYKGETVRWSLNVVQQDVQMAVKSVVPWCYSADITGEFDGGTAPDLEYRADADSDWSKSSGIKTEGTVISAKLTGLKEGTLYHVRFSRDGKPGKETSFTTTTPVQIDNMGFDSWYYTGSESRPIWYPNLNETVTTWGTANPGSGTFVGSLTSRSDKVCMAGKGDGKYAARLESKYAIIAFAAGNLFTGSFGRINGLGAILDWGVPFTSRPSALKGYYAYEPKLIDRVKSPYESLENTMDKCQILVILTDWTGPFTINTTDGIFLDQENDPSIIAYGKYESDLNTFNSTDPVPDANGYIPFEIEIDYRRPNDTPTYAVVVACSSYKGDYFTGGVGSVMYVDEFEFVYE